VFEVGEGVDRTATQTTNSRAVFSTDWDTIKSAKLSTSDDQYRNYAYAAGQGVGVDRNVREVYSTTAEPTDLDRKEIFIDARDADNDTDLDSRAAQRLGELNIQTTIDGMPLTYSPLVYQTDYDLGDYVTIEAYGQSSEHQINEVKESWAPLSYNIDCVFDKEPASLPAQVNTAVKSLQAAFTQTEGYIVESGSNSNGSYIKFSDGTMIQRGKLAIASRTFSAAGSIGVSVVTVTLPTAFIDTTYDYVDTPIANSGFAMWMGQANDSTRTTTAVPRYICFYTTGTQSAGVSWVAVGRWKA
jgi:hypothetical protein